MIQIYHGIFSLHGNIHRRALCCEVKFLKGFQYLYVATQRLLMLSSGHQVMCTGHLLASAGMDHTVYIWNVWNTEQKNARVFSFHNEAVKDVKWSQDRLFVLSCGYDLSARLADFEKGIKFQTDNSYLFLSGGSKGRIRLWDIRTGDIAHEFLRGLGTILDIEFVTDGKQFISSSDATGGNISENSILFGISQDRFHCLISFWI